MKCIVVIPVYKVNPTEDEKKSFIQCLNIFRLHQITLVCSENFDETSYKLITKDQKTEVKIERFRDEYFSDIAGYNRMMLSIEFYRRFKEEYILLYQLDAWVFRDELTDWCRKCFDYIGAPWFENWHEASKVSPLIGVGNGGLSLRNVKKTIRLIKRMKIATRIFDKLQKRRKYARIFMSEDKFEKLISYLNERRKKGINEDYQIHQLSKVYPWYKIASIDEAIKFSFDVNPSLLYEMNNLTLPFGCHGWNRYEKNFWEQFI